MRLDIQELDAYGVLWLAVLHKAVEDASAPLAPPTHDRQGDGFYQRRARLWMVTARKGVGSLTWICNVLGLNPEDVRAEVRRRLTDTTEAAKARSYVPVRMVSGPSKLTGAFHGNQHTAARS